MIALQPIRQTQPEASANPPLPVITMAVLLTISVTTYVVGVVSGVLV